MGRTLELGCGWELRPVNCTSLVLAEEMGDMTQPLSAFRAPSSLASNRWPVKKPWRIMQSWTSGLRG